MLCMAISVNYSFPVFYHISELRIEVVSLKLQLVNALSGSCNQILLHLVTMLPIFFGILLFLFA